MNLQLEAKVTMDEFKAALFSMDPDKAPGPDGFSTRFLQSYWHIVGKDLLKMIQKFQDCQKIGGSTNSSFLALIPKEKGANSFNRFRPISLCNIGYKLITKIIASRLKLILPKIILENQGGFIHGRQLVDNFILVQEAILSSHQCKERGMAIKLDLANAFGGVRHSFLLNVLKKFGFGERFINWIQACISEPWIAPLINGRATDDTLLLGAASIHSTTRFKEVLDEFGKMTGSSLNKGKCNIYCWNTSPPMLNSIAQCLGVAATDVWTSFKYLGMPIFLKRAYSRDWIPQLEKFKIKLQAWGYNWLNIAGKSILIKSVLFSLPLFQFSVLLAPVNILQKMD
eukprot:PITA_02867